MYAGVSTEPKSQWIVTETAGAQAPPDKHAQLVVGVPGRPVCNTVMLVGIKGVLLVQQHGNISIGENPSLPYLHKHLTGRV